MSLGDPMARIQNVEDRKSSEGKWLKFYTENGVGHVTRASMVWFNMKARCDDHRAYKIKNPVYKDSKNNFKGFQDFADWCQSEHGYMSKESNGFFWSLDKDLILLGNKNYSEDTCMFIPNRLNMLMNGVRIKSEYPYGVSYYKQTNRLKAQSHDAKGVKVALGYFHCALEAHLAFQKHKVEVFKSLLREDPIVREHQKLKLSIERLMSVYETDISEKRETKFY